MAPRPTSIATDSATKTATPIAIGPAPRKPTVPPPTAMPSATPTIIWVARRARSTLLADMHTTAEIGAKNGC